MDMESDTVGTIDRRKRKLEGRYDGAKLKDLLLLVPCIRNVLQYALR